MAKTADEARAEAAKAEAARVAAEAAAAADTSALAKRFGPGGDLSIQQDPYGNYRLSQNRSGKSERVYFVPSSTNGANWSIATESDMLKLYKTYATSSGGLEALRKKLYELGFISKPDYTRQDESSFNNAIIDAANSHTMEQVQKYTLNPGQKAYKFDTFAAWLGTKKSTITGDTPKPPDIDTQLEATRRKDADQDIQGFIFELTGMNATQEQKDEYYRLLTEEQLTASRKATKKNTVQTTTGEFLNEDDYFRIASKVVAPSLKGTALEGIDKIGGKVAKQILELKDFAGEYGIQLDSKQAFDYVSSGLTVGGSLNTGALDTQKNTIRQLSKAFYGNIGSLIDAGVKPVDIANQFAALKSKVLEKPSNAFSIFDKDIQNAIKNSGKSGVMSFDDYTKYLRTSAETKEDFRKTKGAREEAANYATSILRSFGLVG
jgi:hypothetical protein